MTFEIDTGIAADDPLRFVPDWFRDTYRQEPDASRIIHDYGYHLIGALNDPKKIDTVRKHTLAQWGFLRVLAEHHPGVFDEFICTYAERVLCI